jgi:hypothetical protein
VAAHSEAVYVLMTGHGVSLVVAVARVTEPAAFLARARDGGISGADSATRYGLPIARPDKLATMAMRMLQTLYDATGGRLDWRGIDLVVSKPEHVETREYAIGQGWIEASLGLHSVRLTAEGRRVLIR